MKVAKVCLDSPDGGFTVPPTPAIIDTAYLWNGFQTPSFTKENADAVMEAWNANAESEGEKMWFDPQCDGYCVSFDDPEEIQAFIGEDIQFDGQTVHVYDIGSMVLCWDLEPEEEEVA